jgi:hypothetical protein
MSNTEGFDWAFERDLAEQTLLAIHERCKGRPLATLRAMPAAAHALQRLFVASFKARLYSQD